MEEVARDEDLMTLPVERVHPNPSQPRRLFKEDALRELARSILTQGVIQPLIVRPSRHREGCYELVAGERRWRAIQLAGLATVPVVVKRISDHDLLEIALLENIQRENLTPIEEASCYRDLLQRHGYTQEVLARRLGKDRSTIANLIRLLQLPAAIQGDLEEGRMTIGHARCLLGLHNLEDQLATREQLLRRNWSVRQTEAHVKSLAAKYGAVRRGRARGMEAESDDIEMRALAYDLERRLGMPVEIRFVNGRGHVKLDCASLDDFDRVLQLLNG